MDLKVVIDSRCHMLCIKMKVVYYLSKKKMKVVYHFYIKRRSAYKVCVAGWLSKILVKGSFAKLIAKLEIPLMMNSLTNWLYFLQHCYTCWMKESIKMINGMFCQLS